VSTLVEQILCYIWTLDTVGFRVVIMGFRTENSNSQALWGEDVLVCTTQYLYYILNPTTHRQAPGIVQLVVLLVEGTPSATLNALG
jgi:hypothetical protein